MFHLYKQSVNNKILELEAVVLDISPEIFCVTEHWPKNVVIMYVNIVQCKIITYSSRNNYKGGGTAIFAKHNLELILIRANQEPPKKHCELL